MGDSTLALLNDWLLVLSSDSLFAGIDMGDKDDLGRVFSFVMKPRCRVMEDNGEPVPVTLTFDDEEVGSGRGGWRG